MGQQTAGEEDMIIQRRNFLIGLVAAPLVVKASSLMRLTGEKLVIPPPIKIYNYTENMIVTEVRWEYATHRPLMSEIKGYIAGYPERYHSVTVIGVHGLRPGDKVQLRKRLDYEQGVDYET